MSGPGGPNLEQGRRLLVWFEANYKKLAVALGGVWLVAAGAAALKATRGAQPRPDALPSSQQQQAPSADQLAALLQQQEAAAREQMRREARWEQEERQEQDIRRDEDRDWGQGRRL